MDGKQYFERVRELSKKSGKSIKWICTEAGISRATVGLWRTGETAPSLRTWNKFLELETRLLNDATQTIPN